MSSITNLSQEEIKVLYSSPPDSRSVFLINFAFAITGLISGAIDYVVAPLLVDYTHDFSETLSGKFEVIKGSVTDAPNSDPFFLYAAVFLLVLLFHIATQQIFELANKKSILLLALFLSALGLFMIIDYVHKELDTARFFIAVLLINLSRFLSIFCLKAVQADVVGIQREAEDYKTAFCFLTLFYGVGAVWTQFAMRAVGLSLAFSPLAMF